MKWDDVTRFRNLDSPNGTIQAVMESLRLQNYSSTATDVICLAVTGRAYDESLLKKVFERRLMREKVWLFSPIPRDMRHPNLKITHVPAVSHEEFSLKIAAHLERHLVAAVSRQADRWDKKTIDYATSERFYPPLDCVVSGFRSSLAGRIPFEACLYRHSPYLIAEISNSDRNLADVPLMEHATRGRRFSFVGIRVSPAGVDLSKSGQSGRLSPELLADITNMVRDISMATRIPARRVVLTGAGSAGQLALLVGAAIPGAKVVVDNCLAGAIKDDGKVDVSTVGGLPRSVVLQNTEDQAITASVLDRIKVAMSELSDNPIKMIGYNQKNLRTGVALPLKNSARLRVIQKLMSGVELDEQLDQEEVFRD